ncbi:hypothetical protein KKH18_03365 [bacterium]|nr:hypothetical protein [bacterium]
MSVNTLQSIFKPVGCVPRYKHWDEAIIEIPRPDYVAIPLEYPGQLYYFPKVELGQQVRRFQIIGTTKLGHCVHAPVSGIVRDILLVWTALGFNVPAMLIQSNDEPALPIEELLSSVESSTERLTLTRKLKGLGIISPWTTSGKFHHEEDKDYPEINTIVIKGVNEESSVFILELLLKQKAEIIRKGISRLSDLAPKAKIILTVPKYLEALAKAKIGSQVSVKALPYEYGDRVEQLVVPKLANRAIPNTEAYRDYGVAVLSTEFVINIVEAIENVQPFVDKYLTIAGTDIPKPRTIKFPIGTTIRHILKSLGYDRKKYARILVGGPMKGRAQYTTYTPLTKSSHGLYLMTDAEIPPEENFTCINCGRCTRVCTANLQVHLIARYAEYNMLPDTKQYYPEACNGCGLCGYVCPAHRPLVQFVEMAKKYGTEDDYVPQTECSGGASLERWELDFQNSDPLAAGAAADRRG